MVDTQVVHDSHRKPLSLWYVSSRDALEAIEDGLRVP